MAQARFKQLVDALAADIREGRLPPGTRLPTHRKLAAKQRIALATATRVYAELAAIGLVSGETGRYVIQLQSAWAGSATNTQSRRNR
jgi:DNA-binding transcriptional regulator YhcF (GntR family)